MEQLSFWCWWLIDWGRLLVWALDEECGVLRTLELSCARAGEEDCGRANRSELEKIAGGGSSKEWKRRVGTPEGIGVGEGRVIECDLLSQSPLGWDHRCCRVCVCFGEAIVYVDESK